MTETIEEIKKLCRKADQTRSMHGIIENNFALANRIILLYVAIGSAIVAMLIFASIPVTYQVWIGFFSASIFIISIIPGTLNFDLEIMERKMAVQKWGEWIRKASFFCNVDIYNMNQEDIEARRKELLLGYQQVMHVTLLIPDSKFNKYKRKHLQKVEISMTLDKNPFETLRKIKKYLKNNKDRK